jgi:hypothetical protein
MACLLLLGTRWRPAAAGPRRRSVCPARRCSRRSAADVWPPALQVPQLLPEHLRISHGLAVGLALHVLALLSWGLSYVMWRAVLA